MNANEELLIWHNAAKERPDADESVLLFNDGYDPTVVEGRWDGKTWRRNCGYIDDPVLSDDPDESTSGDPAPTHWSRWPEGPLIK